jgi:hypothetical protein
VKSVVIMKAHGRSCPHKRTGSEEDRSTFCSINPELKSGSRTDPRRGEGYSWLVLRCSHDVMDECPGRIAIRINALLSPRTQIVNGDHG